MLSISPSVFPTLPSPQVMILPVLWSQPTSTPVSWKSTSARRTIALTCQWGLHTNTATSKQHAPTESDHVVTKEFVFSDKANPFFLLLLSPSCFSEVHSAPGPNYSSPQAGVSSSGGLVCGVSPPIPLRQGVLPPGPPNCQNTYPPGPSLGLRHNYPCLGQQQQAHIKTEHRGHYAPGWAQFQGGKWMGVQDRENIAWVDTKECWRNVRDATGNAHLIMKWGTRRSRWRCISFSNVWWNQSHTPPQVHYAINTWLSFHLYK